MEQDMSQAEAYRILGIDQDDTCESITVSIAHWVMMSQKERREIRWDFDSVTIDMGDNFKVVFDEIGRGDDRAHEDAWKNDGGIVTAPEGRDQAAIDEMFHAFAKVSGIAWYWIHDHQMIVNEMDGF